MAATNLKDYRAFQTVIRISDEGYSFSRIMYVALTCCWSRLYVSIRKVLRPAISAQVLLGFPVSVYKRMLGWFPVLQVATACFSCSPPRSNQNPPKLMFVMFDMYVKLPPDASPIAVNKFYLLTCLLTYLLTYFHCLRNSSLFQIELISLWVSERIALRPALISSSGIR